METQEDASPTSAAENKGNGMSQGHDASFAFLVHSQDSVNHQTPPDIDNQRLIRQKRRRTRSKPPRQANMTCVY